MVEEAEEMTPEIPKYLNIQVGPRTSIGLIQFHPFLILSGSKKVSLVIVILLQLNETANVVELRSTFVNMKTISSFDCKAFGRHGSWLLLNIGEERKFSCTALAKQSTQIQNLKFFFYLIYIIIHP